MATRLLLIDDNLPDRVRYRRMLQRENQAYEIVEAEDGASGLAALQGARFDCVLLDQELPDIQGLDVLVDIRALPDPPPVVMLTGEEDAAVSIDALRRGASDYLMKRRIDEDRLQRALLGAMERHRLARQLKDNQQRLARFYRLANQTEDALFIAEAGSARITDCNASARARLRLPEDAGDAVPAAFASAGDWQAFCQQAQTDGSARCEWQFTLEDGGSACIEILARCIEEDGRPYIVAVGRDISIAKQREQELLERSLRDGLTSVWNRRAFDERLAEAWRVASRNGRPLAVLMIDVDHFKLYNDSAGHPAGDEVLRQIATTLKTSLRRSLDLVARYGGEEFACLLPGAELAAGRQIAEYLRQAVFDLGLEHPSSPSATKVTISAGIAWGQPGPELPPYALVELADRNLYHAKRSGRNRCYP